MAEAPERQKVIVIGAGPVGALAALYAARRGDEVEVYELRDDLRDPSTTPLNFTKSINLALSERGINAMRDAECDGLLQSILDETISMHARMIHGRTKGGRMYEESQPYDAHGRFLRAVDRAGLNKKLLDTLDTIPNVTVHFNHKMTGADYKRGVAWFEQHSHGLRTDHAQHPTEANDSSKHLWQAPKRPSEISVDFDFLIGADGAHSAARFHLMKYARLDYQQEYIDTLWCEFRIKPTPNFAISPDHLHIWPGGSLMFIAIPSLDKSFTCTLFAPSDTFTSLEEASSADIVRFFTDRFPGVCPDLISSEDLIEQFSQNPHLPLISIKCTPYHFKASGVVIGDAAHAMVPFYGQGMNAGLEDVRVLFGFLDKFGVYDLEKASSHEREKARARALAEYTRVRTPDAHAINNLALGNYREMGAHVISPLYKLRKWLDEILDVHVPSLGWRTQYTRVSFENQPYSDVIKSVQIQGRIISSALGMSSLAAGILGFIYVRRFMR